MDARTFTATKQKIQRNTVKLMNHVGLCWLGGVTQCGAVHYVDPESPEGADVPTAATDGWNVWYNLGFISRLKSEQEVMALIVHENLHKAYKHMQLWQGLEDQATAGQAMDYVINTDIKGYEARWPELIQLPESGLYHPMFKAMNTKQVYDYLKKNGQPPQGGQGDSSAGDKHLPAPSGSKDISAEQTRAIEAALREGLMLQRVKERQANAKGGANRALDELQPPQLPWYELVQQWLSERMAGTELPTYSRLHRRTALTGIPTPTRYDETLGDIVIAIDTSGSVSGKELRTMMADTVALLKAAPPANVHLLYWGSKVVRSETYNRDNLDDMLKSTKPTDGGGTDVGCVAHWITKSNINAQLCVVFTDGYVGNSWDTYWPCPVFAVLTSDQTAPFPSARLQV